MYTVKFRTYPIDTLPFPPAPLLQDLPLPCHATPCHTLYTPVVVGTPHIAPWLFIHTVAHVCPCTRFRTTVILPIYQHAFLHMTRWYIWPGPHAHVTFSQLLRCRAAIMVAPATACAYTNITDACQQPRTAISTHTVPSSPVDYIVPWAYPLPSCCWRLKPKFTFITLAFTYAPALRRAWPYSSSRTIA